MARNNGLAGIMIRKKFDLYSLEVSFFQKRNCPKYIDMPIGRVMRGIKDGAYRIEIEKARTCLSEGDLDGYDGIKSELPAVTFSASYDNKRRAEELVHYNSVLVFDIDKLNDEELIRIREVLLHDVFIAAFWLSPSAKGYKGLVHLQYDDEYAEVSLKEKHNQAFEQFFQYLLVNYGIELDKSGRDIQRLCFMSSDEELFVREEAEAFEVVYSYEANEKERKGNENQNRHKEGKPGTTVSISPLDWKAIYAKRVEYKDHARNRSIISFILKKLRKKDLSITDTWENWTKVAFAIASSLHPETGKDLFLQFCRLDGAKHDEMRSERLIWEAYASNQGMCHVETIIYLARQKGIVLDR